MYNCIFIHRSVEVWIFCGIYDFMHLTFLLVGNYFYFLLYICICLFQCGRGIKVIDH